MKNIQEEKNSDLPSEWSVVKFKNLADFKNGLNFSKNDVNCNGKLLADVLNMYGSSVFVDTSKFYRICKDFPDDFLLEKGDILFVRSSLKREGVGWPALFEGYKEPVSFCGFLIRARVDQSRVSPKYLAYFLRSPQVRNKTIGLSGTVAITNIGQSSLGLLEIILPPLPEQQKIAEILSTVDAAIEKTDAIIKETQQLKKGLMQKLFTEGIGHTKFKETRFGRVPENWMIFKGSEISSKITKGASPKWQGYEYQTDGMLFVTSENVRSGYLEIKNPKYLPLEFHQKLKSSQLKFGDILINIVGASIGRSCLFDVEHTEANINQAVCMMRVKKQALPRYVHYFLQFPKTVQRLLGTQAGSARNNLSLSDIKNFQFIIPPVNEQERIVEIISKVDLKLQNERNTKAELEQLKKGLMQVLLTGKVRVKV